MTHKDAVEAIARIERAFNVTELSFRGVRIWPLVRQRLWAGLVNPHLHPSTLDPEFRRDIAYGLAEETLAALEERGQCDLLFLARPEDDRERIHGKGCNPHLDPIIKTLEASSSCLKVQEAAGRPGTDHLIPPLPLQYAMRVRGPFPEERIEDFEPLRDLIERECAFRLDHDLIVKDLLVALAFEAMYGKMLDRVRPKAVFQICYYHPPMNGLMLACHKRGVACVDVQHGKQGRYHGAYTHWSAAPGNGWAMLPSHFWCWGTPTRRDMERGRPAGCAAPRAVVGGFPWLDYWRNHPVPETEATKRLAQGKTAVLATLQPAWEAVPDELIEAMLASPGHWRWLVRAHPKQRERLPELEAQLERAIPDRFELRQSTALPLYALFQASQCHVTAYSSCCYEARHFGLPSVLWGERARTIFAADIESGTFRHAMTGPEIVEKIEAALTTPADKGREPSFFETDASAVSLGLAAVLSRANRTLS